jgi:hypothetical protein
MEACTCENASKGFQFPVSASSDVVLRMKSYSCILEFVALMGVELEELDMAGSKSSQG